MEIDKLIEEEESKRDEQLITQQEILDDEEIPESEKIAELRRKSNDYFGLTNDVIRDYLKKIGETPLLKLEEEQKLTQEYARTKSKNIRNKLIQHNLRLVVSIAKKYIGKGLPFMDLIQEGNLGLAKGIDKFKPEKGYKLSTYVSWWIRQGVTRALSDKSRVIRLPVHTIETINKYKRYRRHFSDQGRDPDSVPLSEYAELCQETESAIERAIGALTQYGGHITSLDLQKENDPSFSYYDVTKGSDSFEEAKDHELDLEFLLSKAGLTDKQRFVFLNYHSDHKVTLEVIGKKIGTTREAVRQVLNRATEKLHDAYFNKT